MAPNTVEEFKDFSDARRAKLAKEHKARPGGGYPIEDLSDLDNAIQAYGRAVAAGEGPSVKAWILKRARELNAPQDLMDRANALGEDAKTAALEERIEALELAVMALGAQVSQSF